MTTQEKNELLAKFMGISRIQDPYSKSKKLYWDYDEIFLLSESLFFDIDPKWILPVWYKFRELWRDLNVSQEDEDRYWDHKELIGEAFSSGTFADLYDALVNAVQWYNSIKQKDNGSKF